MHGCAHIGQWLIVGVENVLQCLKVQSLVRTKREVKLHNEVRNGCICPPAREDRKCQNEIHCVLFRTVS